MNGWFDVIPVFVWIAVAFAAVVYLALVYTSKGED